MARSSLFRTLRKLMKKAQAGAPPSREGWSRRAFLETLGAASLVPLAAACGDNVVPAGPPPIAIIGGGIAGLTAAHFLGLAGVRAEVFEGQMRVGGRMFTQNATQGGQIVELGGELVDTDHLVVPALCQTFGLTLDNLVDATAGLKQDTFFFNNAVLTDVAIVNAFKPVAAKMQINILAADGEDPASVAEFERIDAMSIPDWLTTEAGLAANSVIKKLLEVAYLEEYGLEVAEQSAWNLLFLIDSETPDPFRVFGDSDEVFHIHEGSNALPTAIAATIEDQIHLDHRLTKVVAVGDEYDLTFSTSDGEVTFHAAHVVHALPFTKLREVDLEGAGLSADKRNTIDTLGYGTNAKLMMQFTDRNWETAHNNSGSVITDVTDVQTMWATSRGQAGAEGILTNFVGGTRGIAMGDGTAESQAQMVLPHIDTIFSGTSAKYIANSAIRQHWPSFEFTKGSYASYKVGQWAFFGTEGQREANQHFCGEHCSEDFQGYMEGGAETGAFVAAEILDDLGIAKPGRLVQILGALAQKPRASYHAGFGKRMKLSQIRVRSIG